MAESAEQFIRRFASPLLLGGGAACGPYVGAGASKAWGAFPLAGVYPGMRARAAGVDPSPPGNPDVAVTAMLAAGHDLLSTVHPDAPNLLGSAARVLRAHTQVLLDISWPDAMPQALARHAVMDAITSAVRTDTLVRWWTGSELFHGQEPPRRLLLWPDARRVRTERRRVPLYRLALSEGRPRLRQTRRELLDALGVCSPLTPLWLASGDALPVPLDLRQPGDKGEHTFAALRFVDHLPLRTAIADRVLAAGFVGPVVSISAAVNQLLTSANPPGWVVVRALKLVNTLHERRLLARLLELERPGAKPAELEPLVPKDVANQPALRLVYALWRASRTALAALGKVPVDPALAGLAADVDKAALSQPVAEMTAGLVRAVDLRLQLGF